MGRPQENERKGIKCRGRLACALACASIVGAGPGCISTTTKTLVLSRPHAATVTSGGRVLGKTPLELEEQAWVWSSRELILRKKGHLPARVELTSSARWVNIGVLSAGCIFGLWTLWPLALLGDRPLEVMVPLKKPKGAKKRKPAFRERPDVTLRPEP